MPTTTWWRSAPRVTRASPAHRTCRRLLRHQPEHGGDQLRRRRDRHAPRCRSARVIPLAGSPRCRASSRTLTSRRSPEGAYNVSVIAQDALGHFSSDPSGIPSVRPRTPASTPPTSRTRSSSTRRGRGSITASMPPPTTPTPRRPTATSATSPILDFEDSVWVEVQLQDLVSNQVRSNIARMEGFLEGTIGRHRRHYRRQHAVHFVEQGRRPECLRRSGTGGHRSQRRRLGHRVHCLRRRVRQPDREGVRARAALDDAATRRRYPPDVRSRGGLGR